MSLVNTRFSLSATGVIRTTSSRFSDVKHYTGSGANDHPTVDDVACSEVLVMGHPTNNGMIWVTAGKVASTSNAFPLQARDAVSVAVNNVNELSILVEVSGETAILAIAA